MRKKKQKNHWKEHKSQPEITFMKKRGKSFFFLEIRGNITNVVFFHKRKLKKKKQKAERMSRYVWVTAKCFRFRKEVYSIPHSVHLSISFGKYPKIFLLLRLSLISLPFPSSFIFFGYLENSFSIFTLGNFLIQFRGFRKCFFIFAISSTIKKKKKIFFCYEVCFFPGRI